MAKSARSSNIKKNRSALKKRVFGPVEQARAERLNKKLLELAQQAKPSDTAKMDLDSSEQQQQQQQQQQQHISPEDMAVGDEDNNAGAVSEVRSNTALKKARAAKKNKIEKKKFRKERNRIAFKKHPMKSKR